MQSLSLNLDFISLDTQSMPRADGAGLLPGALNIASGDAQQHFRSLLSERLEAVQADENAAESTAAGLPLMGLGANLAMPENVALGLLRTGQVTPPSSAMPPPLNRLPTPMSAALDGEVAGGKLLPPGTSPLSLGLPPMPVGEAGLPFTTAQPATHATLPAMMPTAGAEASTPSLSAPSLMQSGQPPHPQLFVDANAAHGFPPAGRWEQRQALTGDVAAMASSPAAAAPLVGAAARPAAGSIPRPQINTRVEPQSAPAQMPAPLESAPLDAGNHPTAQWLEQAITAARGQPTMAASRSAVGVASAVPIEGAEDGESLFDLASVEGTDAAELLSTAPGSASRAAPSVPVFSLGRGVAAVDWSDALGSRLQTMMSQNLQKAQIRLDPPELGAVEVQISMSERGAQVLFAAENAAAREALDAALPRLHELMNQAGFADLQAEVSDGRHGQGGDGEQSLADSGAATDAPDDDAGPVVNTSVRAQLDDSGFDAYA